jgi:hypothetical protein
VSIQEMLQKYNGCANGQWQNKHITTCRSLLWLMAWNEVVVAYIIVLSQNLSAWLRKTRKAQEWWSETQPRFKSGFSKYSGTITLNYPATWKTERRREDNAESILAKFWLRFLMCPLVPPCKYQDTTLTQWAKHGVTDC